MAIIRIRTFLNKEIVKVSLLFALFFIGFYWKVFFLGNAISDIDTLHLYYPWKFSHERGVQNITYDNYFSDFVTHYIPIRNSVVNRLREGELPLWDSNTMSGIPFISVPYSGLFYPTTYLLLLCSDQNYYWWMTVLTIIEQFICALALFAFARAIGVKLWGAIVAAFVFIFNIHVFAPIVFPFDISTYIWFPLLFLSGEKYIQTRNFWWVIWGAVSLGLSLLAGNLEISFFLLTAYSAYFVWRVFGLSIPDMGRIRLKLFLAFCTQIISGVLLAAVVIIPFIALSQFSQRVVEVAGHSFSLPLISYTTLLLPDFLGNPANGSYWLNDFGSTLFGAKSPLGTIGKFGGWIFGTGSMYYAINLYIGIIPLVLAILAWFYTASGKFFKWMSVLVLLFMSLSPLLDYIKNFIPILDQMRSFQRMLIIYVFSTAILSGLGLDLICHTSSSLDLQKMKKWLRRILIAIASMLATFTIIKIFGETLILNKANSLVETAYYNKVIVSTLQHLLERVQFLIRSTLSSISLFNERNLISIVLLCAMLMLLFYRDKIQMSIWKASLVGLVMIDLISLVYPYVKFARTEEIFPKQNSIEFLRSDQDYYRVAGIQTFSTQRWRASLPSVIPYRMIEAYGVKNFGGYTSIYPLRYRKFLNALETSSTTDLTSLFEHSVSLTNSNSRLFDLMNVKYLMTGPDDSLRGQYLKMVYSGEMNIYQNTNVLPRVYIVHDYHVVTEEKSLLQKMINGDFDPRQVILLEESPRIKNVVHKDNTYDFNNARIVDYRSNDVVVECELESQGFLILADNNFMDWKAYVDGVELPIYTANYLSRAVYLEKGKHYVHFSYEPIYFKWGVIISLFTLISMIIIGIILIPDWRKFK